jgi:hypothetical protein
MSSMWVSIGHNLVELAIRHVAQSLIAVSVPHYTISKNSVHHSCHTTATQGSCMAISRTVTRTVTTIVIRTVTRTVTKKRYLHWRFHPGHTVCAVVQSDSPLVAALLLGLPLLAVDSAPFRRKETVPQNGPQIVPQGVSQRLFCLKCQSCC